MADPISLPSRDDLLRMFGYNADTGILTRKWRDDIPQKINKRCAGKMAGHRSKRGYVQVGIGPTLFLAHRIVWKMVHDEEPSELDHVNGDRSDNRLANLRKATRSENLSNRGRKPGKALPKGVKRSASAATFHAEIHVCGRTVYLGSFKDVASAHAAYCAAAIHHYGEFARFD